jgi:4-hydroxy-tetrahydrodipicolinate synthase
VFDGLISQLVTPFRDGAPDEDAFCSLVDWEIVEGVEGLVPCGATGEAPTLKKFEWARLVELCVETAAGRVPVIAAIVSSSTDTAITLADIASRAGANAALVVAPSYSRPSQEGLYRHFEAVAKSTALPIIVGNEPDRCVVDLQPPTVARLARIPNIVGLKDGSGDLRRPGEIAALVPADFVLLSGDDRTALAFNAAGGRGCVSDAANVMPRLCAALQRAWRSGDAPAAYAVQGLLFPLAQALALEPSPGPVKYALSLLRGMRNELRLPLVPVGEAVAEKISQAIDTVFRAQRACVGEPDVRAAGR